MKALKITTIIFLILILFTVGIAVAETFFGWTYPTEMGFSAVNIVATIVLFIFGLMCVASIFMRKFSFRRIGFYLMHVGVAVFLLGTLLFKITGEYVTVSVPIDSYTYYSSIIKEDGTEMDLGFEFAVTDFATDYYFPTYNVYKMSSDGNKLLRENVEYDATNELYDFKEYGKYAFSKDDATNIDNFPSYFNLSTDGVVATLNVQPKQYTAYIAFSGDDTEKKELKVNYPIYKNGFKIYLMSYNQEHKNVNLLFKKDIGEVLSTSGIIMLIAGAVLHCIILPLVFKAKIQLTGDEQ